MVAAVGAAAFTVAAPAEAALSTGCTQTAGTGNVSCSFTATGEHPIVVPPGVTSVHVTAVGAQGGAAVGPGGVGASVVADLAVTAGTTIYAEVNVGGGPGGASGIGVGGGASDLRTCSTSSTCGALGTVADPRLVVAGGGGGQGLAGGGGSGGAGGAGGSTACNAGGDGGNGQAGTFRGGGGGGGTCVSGGAAGLGAGAANGVAGAAGGGGTGSAAGQGAGGGGGGYFGGGGGGGDGIPGNAGGGGGGSSFAAATAANVVMSAAASSTASFAVTFVRPTDHLVVIPAATNLVDGASQVFVVTAVDSDGNSLGDVTGASTLTIAGGGSCAGPSCTASGIGAHVVTATDGSVTGTATLTATAVVAGAITAEPTLPATGAETESLSIVGLGLLAAGLVAISLARRRTSRQS